MATATEHVIDHQQDQQLWSGGVSPFKTSYGKLMMWYFLVSDAFTFAAFLITYGAIRFSNGQESWPEPAKVFDAFPLLGHGYPLMFVSLMTFILIMSSVFMVRAVQEGHMMNRKGVIMWMGLTILGGAAFLGCQAYEWAHMIELGLHGEPGGMTIANPIKYYTGPHHTGDIFVGPLAFGHLFFAITGFHGFHVFTGVVINIIIWIMAIAKVFEKRGHYEMVEKVGLYWHFVDLVWVFVFLGFYLL
jgi:cytochrome c oxidase subunit 3